ncbi:MAG: hypothetical protein ACRBCI_11090 [Cellvibrionaceae bacterium]
MFASKLNKYEKNYDYLVTILKASEIDTKEKVETHLKGVMSKAFKFTVIVAAIIGTLCLTLPKYTPIWGILCILALAWGWTSAISARKIMKDYIRRELDSEEGSES